MAKPKKKKTFAQALKAARKSRTADKAPARFRWSEARQGYYQPIRDRSAKGKRAASKYDVVACSSGATAAMARGFAASPRASCGPKGMGMIRSHRLLGTWKGVTMGTPGSLTRFKKNPKKDGDLAYVWNENPEKGGKIEWGLIEPRSGEVLITGTANTPEAGYKAAHRKANEAMKRGAKMNPGEREAWLAPYAATDVEMKSGTEWTQVPRGGKKNTGKAAKKNTGKRKNPEAARRALRNAMRGT
jgi:hypothetical protein